MFLTSQIEDHIDEPSQGDLFIENQDMCGAYVDIHLMQIVAFDS